MEGIVWGAEALERPVALACIVEITKVHTTKSEIKGFRFMLLPPINNKFADIYI